MNAAESDLLKKKSNNFLIKLIIDYDAQGHEYRGSRIKRAFSLCRSLNTLNVVSYPISILIYVFLEKGKKDDGVVSTNEHLVSFSVANSIVINASIFSTIAFFVLKKCASEGLITGLSTKDIAMISFITFPILAVIFSAAMTAILYKARESCEDTEIKNLDVAVDTYFTNPVTGLIMASAALIGIAEDKLEERKHQSA